MTDEQINIAVAEACGWEIMGDYCHDLNAMHEAEMLLRNKSHDYVFSLAEICRADMGERSYADCFYMLHATARQRAEAFLRTLSKWKEAVNPTEITNHKDDTSHSAIPKADKEPPSP